MGFGFNPFKTIKKALGLSPSKPKMAPMPAMPDYAAAEKARAVAEAADLERRRLRGRASTMLTGGAGLSEEPMLARKTLLGS